MCDYHHTVNVLSGPLICRGKTRCENYYRIEEMSSFEHAPPDFYLPFSLFLSISPLVCLISLVSHGDKEGGL